jgi:pimeloyl-ACP methyl ester carboxylesterase
MVNYYLLPGMGANKRLYEKYSLNGNVKVLEWIDHANATNLEEYAALLAEQIKTSENVIVGSSMGGMMANELSHIVKPAATVLISAPSSRLEFPWTLNALEKTRIHRLASAKATYKLSFLARTFMGFNTKEHDELFFEMLRSNGPRFLHFSVRAVLEWKRTEPPTGEWFQILGGNDKLFKSQTPGRTVQLHGSGHFMAYEQADEISQLINQYVDKIYFKKNETL